MEMNAIVLRKFQSKMYFLQMKMRTNATWNALDPIYIFAGVKIRIQST